MSPATWSVSVVYAAGADVSNWQLVGDEREVREALAWLFKLGHVVSYSIRPGTVPVSTLSLLGILRDRVGWLVMDAIAGCPLPTPDPSATMLVPVWYFIRNADGMLVSTARFQGTDVEITAMPSIDEETGFRIAGQDGLFLPVIMPYPAWRASSVI